MVAWIIIRRVIVEPYMQQQKVNDIERHRAMHHSQLVSTVLLLKPFDRLTFRYLLECSHVAGKPKFQ